MNDTAQETTAAMAVLAEHELLGASLQLLGENLILIPLHTSILLHISVYNTCMWALLYQLALFQSVCQLALFQSVCQLALTLTFHTPLGRDLDSTSHHSHMLHCDMMEQDLVADTGRIYLSSLQYCCMPPQSLHWPEWGDLHSQQCWLEKEKKKKENQSYCRTKQFMIHS